MGVIGNTAVLVALGESVNFCPLPISQACVRHCACSLTSACPGFYVLLSLGTRKYKGHSVELLSEVGKEACGQPTRVAGKVGKFKNSIMAETTYIGVECVLELVLWFHMIWSVVTDHLSVQV